MGHEAVDPARHAEYVPGRWWRVVAPDGSLWCETSVESEARRMVRSGDRLQRLYVLELQEWRDAEQSDESGSAQ